MADYSQNPTYQKLYNQMLGNTGSNGFQWNPANTSDWLNRFGNTFTNSFKTNVGSTPNDQDYTNFYDQVVGGALNSPSGAMGTDPSAMQSAIQSYLPNAYGQQIQQHQVDQAGNIFDQLQQKESKALQDNSSAIQQALGNARQSATDYYTQGQGLESIKRALNSNGMLDSGAFPQTLASVLGQNENNLQNQVLGGFTLPSFGQMQNLPAQATNYGLGNYAGLQNTGLQGQQTLGNRNNSLYDFNLQSDLANRLYQMSQPSGFQNALQNANMASGIYRNLSSGMGSKAQGAGSVMGGVH